LLLIIYPTRLYRSLSQFISARKQLAITSFVESLNGCFKDGLNGTRDYRAYAGLVMLFPLWILVVSYLPFCSGLSLKIRSCYVFSLLSLLISYKRPFKSTVTNVFPSQVWPWRWLSSSLVSLSLSQWWSGHYTKSPAML
ncbi:hypothetical protein GBAR_LOCUS9895, partial [Geodia barretti]